MGDEIYKSLIQQYQGGYCFGLLEVDRVQNAEQPAWTAAAPWIRKLRMYAVQDSQLAACKLYCSNRSANFNQVKVQETYADHLFIWRTGEVDYIRAVSGRDMEAIIRQKLQGKQNQKAVTEVAVNVAGLDAKLTHQVDKISTAALKSFAIASREEEVPQEQVSALLQALTDALERVHAAMAQGTGEEAVYGNP